MNGSSSPMMSPAASPKKISSKVGVAILIAIAAVAIVLILLSAGPPAEAPTNGVVVPPDAGSETAEPPVSGSDNLDTIDQELQGSNTENLDQELNVIEGEL